MNRIHLRDANILRLPLVVVLAVVTLSLSRSQSPKTSPPGVPIPGKVMLAPPSEWSMYGSTPSRNMVNHQARNILQTLTPDKGLGLLWKAKLGSRSYAQPVVADGRVYVGTNNEQPRNLRDQMKNREGDFEPIDKSCLMCFEEATGKFLWQAVHDKLPAGLVQDWPKEGVCSIPTVREDRVYYVSNQCRIVCADVRGFANGNQGMQNEKYQYKTDADFLWEFDMIRELKVFPHNMSTGCPLIIGDLLFVPTSNGVDENHINVPEPDAPSFICLNIKTGKLVWSDNSPGKNIMHGQWASPSYAAEPIPQVIFPGGDGWLRAFDPPTGKLIWKFDCNTKDAVYELGGTGTKSDFIAAPVIYDGRVYIGTGQDPEHFTGIAHFWCIDIAKAVANGANRKDHDVSGELLVGKLKLPDGKPVTKLNPASALLWVFGGEEKRRWARVSVSFVGRHLFHAARERCQKAFHWSDSLRYNARTWHRASEPDSLHRIPEPFSR